MIAALQGFVAALRDEGLASSPAEWIDAVRAVERVGLADRIRFRAALRCTLVKRDELFPVFDRTFDRFFVSPGGSEEQTSRGAGCAAEGRRAQGDGSTRPPRPSARPRSQANGERRADVERAAEARRRLSAIAQGRRERRLRRVVLAPREHAGRAEREGAGPPVERRDLRDPWTAAEEREVADRLQRIVESIRLRTSRRRRRAVSGRLYLRRAFRDNLVHGGVPFVLPQRRALPRRSRIVLWIDVSWSTARAAGLFLSLAGAFVGRARDTRVLLFVDRFVDATRAVERWLRGPMPPAGAAVAGRGPARPGAAVVRGDVSFVRLVDSVGDLHAGAPSDYGRAFHSLLRSTARPAGRGTALVVLGDGRSNRLDPQSWAFEEIAAGCGTVIWVVPEPVDRWGTGDSALFEYLPAVDVAVEARDFAGLARGVEEIVRRGSR